MQSIEDTRIGVRPAMVEPWAAMARSYGRYEVLFPIARGGMGEVIAVRLRREGGFEQYFALKRMRDELAFSEDLVRVFLDEARLTAAIVSPHVVPVIDVGRDDVSAPFLTMELVVGADLRSLRRKNLSISIPALVEIGAQAATGLEAAHRATDVRGRPLEIVHRDVSPQNILLGVDGRARITDFGIARAKARLAQTTQVGLVKGKFGYTAPEQMDGQSDARVDVWALGVVLWEIVVGRPLFTGRSPIDTLRNVRERRVPRLDVLDRRVPPALADLIARSLMRDPDRRIPSAAAFALGLRGLVACGAVAPASPVELRTLALAGGAALAADLKIAASAYLPELTPARATLFGSVDTPSSARRIILPPPAPDLFEAVTVVSPVDSTPLLPVASDASPAPTASPESAPPEATPRLTRVLDSQTRGLRVRGLEVLGLEALRLLLAMVLVLVFGTAFGVVWLAYEGAALARSPPAPSAQVVP